MCLVPGVGVATCVNPIQPQSRSYQSKSSVFWDGSFVASWSGGPCPDSSNRAIHSARFSPDGSLEIGSYDGDACSGTSNVVAIPNGNYLMAYIWGGTFTLILLDPTSTVLDDLVLRSGLYSPALVYLQHGKVALAYSSNTGAYITIILQTSTNLSIPGTCFVAFRQRKGWLTHLWAKH